MIIEGVQGCKDILSDSDLVHWQYYGKIFDLRVEFLLVAASEAYQTKEKRKKLVNLNPCLCSIQITHTVSLNPT